MAGCLLIQRTHAQFPVPTWWQLSGTPALEDPAPFHGLLQCCMYVVHRNLCRQNTHVHKVKRNKSQFLKLKINGDYVSANHDGTQRTIIPPLGWQRQKGISELQASQGYIVRPVSEHINKQ